MQKMHISTQRQFFTCLMNAKVIWT